MQKSITTTYGEVSLLFGKKSAYAVPKYQRAYAWEDEEIEDFLADLEKIFIARKNDNPVSHFFGSIIVVQKLIEGTSNNSLFELVDGQQRIATFVMLMLAVYQELSNLKEEKEVVENYSLLETVNTRIIEIQETFLFFKLDTNQGIKNQKVLTLSNLDNKFFVSLYNNVSTSTSSSYEEEKPKSHKRLENAFNNIKNKVVRLIDSNDIATKIANLKIINDNVLVDFTVVKIDTASKEEASTMFQVLNNRGKNLSNGDLLRAQTLEMLEEFPSIQEEAEGVWDYILSDSPEDTDDFLRHIYVSKKGKRAEKNLLKMFGDSFFAKSQDALTKDKALEILETIREIKKQVVILRKLKEGEWPWSAEKIDTNVVSSWDKSRLSLIVKELKNTSAFPLFLAVAANDLNQKIFLRIVRAVETASFRYTAICQQHYTKITTIYYAEAENIWDKKSAYNPDGLDKKIQALIDEKAGDNVFEVALKTLRYNSNNKILKYFLITLEDYWDWYKNSAKGRPLPDDRAKFYNFADTTIEHIYAQNDGTDPNMKEVANNLGNLTIASLLENDKMANKPFDKKRVILQESNAKMNKTIGQKTDWKRSDISDRTDELIKMAMKIFRLK